MANPVTPILYDGDFGSLSLAWLTELFVKYPPHTPEGKTLFKVLPEGECDGIDFQPIVGLPNYGVGYFYGYFCNDSQTEFYHIEDMKHLHENPYLINYCHSTPDAKGKPRTFYMPAGFKYEITDNLDYQLIKCLPPMKDICDDLLDHISHPDRGRFRSIYTQAILDRKITTDELFAMAAKATRDHYLKS